MMIDRMLQERKYWKSCRQLYIFDIAVVNLQNAVVFESAKLREGLLFIGVEISPPPGVEDWRSGEEDWRNGGQERPLHALRPEASADFKKPTRN